MISSIISSSLSGRDWLAIHDRRDSSPRFERWQDRQTALRKARQQQRMQQRHQLATPLLKGVK
jgi:hypothetical protein